MRREGSASTGAAPAETGRQEDARWWYQARTENVVFPTSLSSHRWLNVRILMSNVHLGSFSVIGTSVIDDLQKDEVF